MDYEKINKQHVITQEYIKLLRDENNKLKAENEMLKRQLYYFVDESIIKTKKVKEILKCEVER